MVAVDLRYYLDIFLVADSWLLIAVAPLVEHRF